MDDQCRKCLTEESTTIEISSEITKLKKQEAETEGEAEVEGLSEQEKNGTETISTRKRTSDEAQCSPTDAKKRTY